MSPKYYVLRVLLLDSQVLLIFLRPPDPKPEALNPLRFGAHTIGEQPKPPPAPTSTSEDAEAAGEWANEPTSATELDRRYEILVTCPGRLASTQLRVCKAVETDQTAAKNVMPEQLYKLFIVDV